MQEMRYFFYLARCSDGSLYAGTTANLRECERRHNEGRGGRDTRTRLPVRIVYSEVCDSMRDARKREVEVKSWPKEDRETLGRQPPISP
ncbi:MAG: GIY-YIG nuclease family protein [Gemmatimonadota bacterium]